MFDKSQLKITEPAASGGVFFGGEVLRNQMEPPVVPLPSMLCFSSKIHAKVVELKKNTWHGLQKNYLDDLCST
jgi:hypothetical protein